MLTIDQNFRYPVQRRRLVRESTSNQGIERNSHTFAIQIDGCSVLPDDQDESSIENVAVASLTRTSWMFAMLPDVLPLLATRLEIPKVALVVVVARLKGILTADTENGSDQQKGRKSRFFIVG